MRNEIIYFLQNVKDVKIMTCIIENLDFNGISTLLNHLQFTEDETEKQWLNAFQHTLGKSFY